MVGAILFDSAGGLIGWFALMAAIIHLAKPSRTGRLVVGLILAGLILTTVAGLLSPHWLDPAHGRWWFRVSMSGLPVLFYLVLGLLVSLAVAGLARRSGKRLGRCLVGLAVVGALTVTSLGYAASTRPVVRPITIVSDQVPAAFDGYTIALLSDIHIGPTMDQAYLQGVVDQVNAARPDLVVIAGDVVDGSVAQLGPELAPLTELDPPDGVIVTTGNHEMKFDPAAWMAYFSRIGLTVLDNDGLELRRGSSSIDLLGVNDRQGTGAYRPDLQLATERLRLASGAPVDGAGRFRIVIAHEPRQARDNHDLAASLGVDLQLSGHTHAGQLWPLGYYQDLIQGASHGVATIGGITVVTSAGLGSSITPVRVGARPEIPLITLTTA